MSDTPKACSRCQGAGSYLQKSVMDPEEVEWDLCAICEGSGVEK